METRRGWWPTFGRLAAMVAAWHALPLIYLGILLAATVAAARREEDCFESCAGFAVLYVLSFSLMTIASVVIGLIVAVVAAFFRPRRAFLTGNLMMLAQAAIITTLLLAGVNR